MKSTVSFRNLRCADGDLAIVINDLHQCRSNIGKLVHVKGPARTLTLPQLPGWHIKPVDRRLWAVQQKDGTFARELVNWNSKVYHEDAWLLPIKLDGHDEAVSSDIAGLPQKVNDLPERAKAGELVASDCIFDFSQLVPGTRFFDWEDMPITTPQDMRSATAWCPQPMPRNPSDVRNKAGEISAAQFANLYFLKAYPWARWPIDIRKLFDGMSKT